VAEHTEIHTLLAVYNKCTEPSLPQEIQFRPFNSWPKTQFLHGICPG